MSTQQMSVEFPTPDFDNEKCLQTLPKCPLEGQNHAQLRTTNLDDEYVRHKLEQGQRF